MSRMPADGRIIVKPSNNIYTALAAAALIAVVSALVFLLVKGPDVGFKLF